MNVHEHEFSIKTLIFYKFDKFLLADNNNKLQNMNSHFHINFLSCSQQDIVFSLTANYCMMNNFYDVNADRNLILHILISVFKLEELS